MKFKKALSLLIVILMAATASCRSARADGETGLDVGIAIGIGLALVTIIGMGVAASHSNFEGHASNEHRSSDVAANKLDQSIVQAFHSPGQKEATTQLAAVSETNALKIAPSAMYVPAHGTTPALASGGVVGTF